jgi:hypothetical protein
MVAPIWSLLGSWHRPQGCSVCVADERSLERFRASFKGYWGVGKLAAVLVVAGNLNVAPGTEYLKDEMIVTVEYCGVPSGNSLCH